MNKKIIAVPVELTPDDMGDVDQSVKSSYIKAISRYGATPFIIPCITSEERLTQLLMLADALVLPGGIDMHPKFYQQNMRPKLGKVDPDLDHFQLKLCEKAMEKRMPILAICRGCQLLNVFLGGTLHQDNSCHSSVQAHWQTAKISETSHWINIEEGSKLNSLFGDRMMVNSFHHQCIDKPGQGVKVVATADDGIIEAIELADYPSVIGVQWHPEMMSLKDDQVKPLFDLFLSF